MRTTIKLLLLYFAYQLLAGAVMAGAGHLWAVPVTTQLACSLLLSGLAMTVHLVAGGYVSLRHSLRPVGMTPMLCSVACVMAAVLGCNALGALLTLPNWLEADFDALSHHALGIAGMALMAPWVEELLFRDAIMHRLHSQGLSPWRSIVVSALVFGLIHVNPAQVFFAFLIGLPLGWVTVCTRSLWPAITAHALNNSLSVVEIVTAGDEGPAIDLAALPYQDLLVIILIGLAASIMLGHKLPHLMELYREQSIKPNNIKEK